MKKSRSVEDSEERVEEAVDHDKDGRLLQSEGPEQVLRTKRDAYRKILAGEGAKRAQVSVATIAVPPWHRTHRI